MKKFFISLCLIAAVLFTSCFQDEAISIVKNGCVDKQFSLTAPDLKSFVKSLVETAYSNNIYNIKIYAPNAMIPGVSDMIRECEHNNYSNNQITVEEF